jgi:hypothetical protein
MNLKKEGKIMINRRERGGRRDYEWFKPFLASVFFQDNLCGLCVLCGDMFSFFFTGNNRCGEKEAW